MTRRLALTIALALLLAPVLSAQRNIGGRAYDKEAITVTSAAVSTFTRTKVDAGPAWLAVFTVECVADTPCFVRFWHDADSTPTATSGQRIGEGGAWTVYELPNIRDFKIIAESNSAILQVQYYQVYAR